MVSKDPNFHVIMCKCVNKIRYNANMQIDQHKVKLVAKGFNQQEGFNFHETFNLVVKHTKIRLLLSIDISQKWYIHQVDV